MSAARCYNPRLRVLLLTDQEPAWLKRHPRRQYHIVPLNHPYVCGLHVPWNMRVVPWRVNASKGNAFNPDQLPLDF
jgi:hypothetical protein